VIVIMFPSLLIPAMEDCAWTDAQNATVCNAVQSYRAASFAAGQHALPAPWPLADCPARFGNTDIWSATTG